MHYLIDLDNTLLRTFKVLPNGKRIFLWTEKIQEDLNISPETLPKLFTQSFMELLQRKTDVIPIVNDYLKSIKSDIRGEDFIEYWLKHNSKLDMEVWNWVKYKKKQGHNIHIASDQTILRMDYLWKHFAEWQDVFDNVFTSAKFNVIYKEDKKFFERVLSELKCSPKDVWLIDDDIINIKSAQRVGINAFLFENAESLKKLDKSFCA